MHNNLFKAWYIITVIVEHDECFTQGLTNDYYVNINQNCLPAVALLTLVHRDKINCLKVHVDLATAGH